MRANLDNVTGTNECAPDAQIGGALAGSGLFATAVACGVPLINGVANGWGVGRSVGYLVLTLIFGVLVRIYAVPGTVAYWISQRLAVHLLLMSVVAWSLQTISGDPFVQPIVFTVPLVHAALAYGPRRTLGVALWLLGLMVLGLWFSGARQPAAVVFPLLSYSALMLLIYAFTRMSVDQATARRHADALAEDLAAQRDYLARLAAVTATLTRNLELQTVVDQIATAGCSLAQADRAYVWLCESSDPDQAAPRLAAHVPPSATVVLTPDVGRVLATAAPYVTDRVVIVPLVFRSGSSGALELHARSDRSFGTDAGRLLQPFADTAAVALENARLYDQARFSATLAERNRLAGELHDTIAQGLTAVTLQLEAAQRAFDRDPQRARARLGRGYELARETLGDVRRSVWTLATPLIDGNTLPAELHALAQRFADRTGVAVHAEHAGTMPTLDHATATQVLRIAQEALHNVEKHAAAQRVVVHSEVRDDQLSLAIRDDGAGFVPDARADKPDQHGGFGLIGMHERARLIHGTLAITSAPDAGTNLTLNVPLQPSRHAQGAAV